MVTLLHRLGVALSYPELRLKDTKVLRPDWMTGAVYKLVNDRKLLESHGVVTLDDLARLLDPVQYPADKYRYLVDVMKKFELCFTLDDDAGTFLIPDILQSDEPAILGKWIPAMELRYQYKILPTSVMSRFIARAHGLAFKNTIGGAASSLSAAAHRLSSALTARTAASRLSSEGRTRTSAPTSSRSSATTSTRFTSRLKGSKPSCVSPSRPEGKLR